jgi:hypothetical protein
MTISQRQRGEIEYTLTDDANEVHDSSEGRSPRLHHGHNDLIPHGPRARGEEGRDSFKSTSRRRTPTGSITTSTS